MEHVIGVRFQEAGKIYYFQAGGYENLQVGEYVVVETSRGLEVARIVIAPDQLVSIELTEPLKPITRIAFDEDLAQAARLRERAATAVDIARKKVSDGSLPMKIVSASFNLDGSRLTLQFTSEERIDFRDLVRDLSGAVRAQVQLRQVGPRDQAKIVDGYGRCGRRLCCSSWLVSFPAISIKMAKEQDLPLNPSKISGQCGRLLCCLSYENDTYRHVKQALPRPGTYVSTPTGNARILSVNVPRDRVTLQMETMEIVDIRIDEFGMDRGLVRILDGPPPPTQVPVVQVAPRPSPPAEGRRGAQHPAATAPATGSPMRRRNPDARHRPVPATSDAAQPERSDVTVREEPKRTPTEAAATERPVVSTQKPSAPQARNRRRRRRGKLGSSAPPPQA